MSRSAAPPTIVTTDLDGHNNHRVLEEIPLDSQAPSSAPSTPPRLNARTLGAPLSPASPTLSSGSYSPTASDFKTSTALRDNYPTMESGRDTLNVVGGAHVGRHERASSNATFLSVEGKEPLSSATTRVTTAYSPSEMHNEKSGTALNKEHLGRAQTDISLDSDGKPHKKSAFGKIKRMFKRKKDEENDEEEHQASAHIDPANDTTDPTPFFHKPYALAALVDPKNLSDLEALGGVDGLLHGLGVDGTKGLTGAPAPAGAVVERGSAGNGPSRSLDAQYNASLADRERVYGKNLVPTKKTKSLLELMWLAMKDKVLIILGIAAVISLALGIYQSVGVEPHYVKRPSCPEGCPVPQVEWVEGVAILIAVLIVVLVGSVNDWQKERQFKKLNEKKEDRMINCIRNGQKMSINTKDIYVGDICVLETGEILPVDGVFLRGHNVKCDESGATGESDLIKKYPYEECIAERDGLKAGEKAKKDCFLLSGAKVQEGVGEYVVIAVGKTSFNGRLLMALRGDDESTPLQEKLNRLAELIAKFGASAGGLLFFALFIRFCVSLKTNPDRTADEKGQAFIQILIISVTLIVVAVPEGLPLAVTLALAFATKRMTKNNLLVRILAACETMANATSIATDKTGTLTLNKMSVVAMSLGVHGKGVSRLEENAGRTNANKVADEEGIVEAENSRKGKADFTFDLTEVNQVASPALQEVLNQSFAINSTAFEDIEVDTGKVGFVGNKTEIAMLTLAKESGWTSARDMREQADVIAVWPFSSEAKCMGSLIRLSNGKYRLLIKGASEILVKSCARHVAVNAPPASNNDMDTVDFNEETISNIERTIIFYANQSLRTLAVCYKDLESWPPKGFTGEAEPTLVDLVKDMTLLAVCALEDPLRPGVIKAVEDCKRAGVTVRMCTGDNVLTARSIATQCGIYTPGGIVIEGPSFRRLTPSERLEIVPRLQIMARSSPEDKRLLVQTLKELGEVVAVTGDGANDAPALKLANVGFSMGIAGTEIAKEASAIIILDDSFPSVVRAITWGRCVNDSVKKFLQFQLSVNVTAVVLTFFTAVISDSEASVLTAVQLLWVNLIMDTFAALALATDPASDKALNRKPERKNTPILSPDMIKMILGQAVFQITVCFVLHWRGHQILRQESNIDTDTELSTLVFNTFVFSQIFNMINCRSLTRSLNFWDGILTNHWFQIIFLIMVGGQVLIVYIGGAAFGVVRLGGRDWAISVIIGLCSIPIGALIRLLPTAPFERLLIKLHLYPDPNALPVAAPSAEDEKYEYNDALVQTKDNLNLFTTIRSGSRLKANPLVMKSRSKRLREANIAYPTLLTMAPSLLLGAVAAGPRFLVPIGDPSFGDPAGQDPSKSSAQLFSGQIQMSFHPETPQNDPLIAKYARRRV